MASQRKADAAIVVSGEGFKSGGWKINALKEYLQNTYAAPVVGEPEVQEDGTVVVVRIGDSSQMSASDLVTEISRCPTHSIADNNVSVGIKPLRERPVPKRRPRSKARDWEENEFEASPGQQPSRPAFYGKRDPREEQTPQSETKPVTVSVDVNGEERYIVMFICNNMRRRHDFKQGFKDCDRVEWKEETGVLVLHGSPPPENASYWKDVTVTRIMDELKRYKAEPIRVTNKTSWDSMIATVEGERKKHDNVVDIFELIDQRKVLVVGKEVDVQSVYRSVSQQLSATDQNPQHQHPPKEEPSDSTDPSVRRSHSQTSFDQQQPVDLEVQIDKKKRPIMTFIVSNHKPNLKRFIDSCSSINWNSRRGILSLQSHPLGQEGAAETWSQKAEDRVEEFLQKYKALPVSIENDDCWDRKVKIAKEEVEHEDVDVMEAQEESKILLVGLKEDVNDAHKSVKEKLSRLEQRKDKKQPTESVVVVKGISSDLYELMSRTMQFRSLQSGVTIEYKGEKLCLNISGETRAMNDANDTLEALRDEMQWMSIPVESHAQEFLSSATGIDQFNSVLASKSIIAKASEVEKDQLKVYLSRGEGGKVKDELRKFLHSETIEVDGDGIAKYVDSQDCQEFLGTVQDKFGVAITCTHHRGKPEKVVIMGQKDKIAEAKEKIELHLLKRAEVCETVPLSDHAVAEFFKRYMESDIKAIENEQSKHETQVEVRDDVTPPVIEYRCKNTGASAVSKQVRALMERCKGSSSKEFKKHGLKKLVHRSFTFHHEVEKNRKVVIKVQQDQSLPSYARSRNRSTARANKPASSQTLMLSKHCCTQQADRSITLYSGDICHHAADAIVSTANQDLDFSAGLPSYLVKCGGDTIEKECRDYLSKKSSNRLATGDVICTSAGRLTTTDHIIHVVGPKWPQGVTAGSGSSEIKTTERLLRKAVFSALNEGTRLGCTSVALPAISAGGFGCPSDFVAQNMVQGIDEFLGGKQCKQLRDVHIVLLDRDQTNIHAFQEELVNKLDKRSIPGPPPPSKSKTGLNVIVTRGDLSTQQVDVIVSSAADTLDLQAAQASKVLAQKAGLGLQQECSAYVTNYGSLKNGDLVVTKGYNLHCKHILHANCPASKPGLTEIVSRAITMADSLGAHSIAFPALGTGGLGMGDTDAANALFQGIYGVTNTNNLQQVNVVIFDAPKLSVYKQAQSTLVPSPSRGHVPQSANTHPVGRSTYVPPPSPRVHISSDDGEEVPEDPEPVSFLVVGESQSDCNEAMSDLTKLVDELCVERQIKTEVAQYLIDTIRNDAARLGVYVKVTLENRKPKLLLAGTKEDVSSVADAITCHTSKMQEKQSKQIEEKQICSEVQWVYEDDNKKFTPYPSDVIVLLERAHRKKENVVQLNVSSYQRQCTVNLQLKQETDQRTGKRRKVEREEIQTMVLEIPKEWERLPCGTNYDYRIVPLSPSSHEYKDVSERFQKTVQLHLRQNAPVPPYPSLVTIERVQNPRMYHKYLQEKDALRKKRAAQLKGNKATLEMELFHGTGPDAIDHIVSNGFNRSYAGKAVGKLYGSGVYFAKNSGYSLGYAPADPNNQNRRKMFLCKVLLGMWTKGEEQMCEPPIIDTSVNKVDRYDSTVDNPSNPAIFVSCFRDNMVYPAYIITYTHAV